MATQNGNVGLPQSIRWLLISLLLVSTALYTVGVTLEQGSERQEMTVTHQETGEGQAAHSEANETHTDISTPNVPGTPHQESLFGINLESPWFIVLALLSSLTLIVILLRFERTALVLIFAFSIAAILLDGLEVVTQVNRSNPGLVIMAIIVGLAHAALGLTATFALSRYRPNGLQPESRSAIS